MVHLAQAHPGYMEQVSGAAPNSSQPLPILGPPVRARSSIAASPESRGQASPLAIGAPPSVSAIVPIAALPSSNGFDFQSCAEMDLASLLAWRHHGGEA
eukprot:819676-Pyramimonas_sp.AAC.1